MQEFADKGAFSTMSWNPVRVDSHGMATRRHCTFSIAKGRQAASATLFWLNTRNHSILHTDGDQTIARTSKEQFKLLISCSRGQLTAGS